jgi:uncharacterized protein (TIGR00255 family)
MPVYSMTGYASVQSGAATTGVDHDTKSGAQRRLGLEIRSVNSRFLDLSFRLSEELRASEPAIRELLGSKLKRGKVEVRAAVEGGDAALLKDPSARLLQRLGSLQDTVRSWLPDATALSVGEVLRLASADDGGSQQHAPALLKLAQKALEELLAAREREGARLAATLLERTAQLRLLAQAAVPLVPQLVEQQRNRFLERWKDAMALGEGAGAAALEAAQDRALTEATAFAMRIDVAEEITRLSSHLDEIERLLNDKKKGSSELGKRLDFLTQELHREANTLGSKSAALELTRISVDMKVLIEQMREQVQNIE